MGQCYGQLSLEERVEIYRLHAGGKSQNEIASALDRAPSTISRELRRNSRPTKVWAGGYEPVRAQQLAERRRRWDWPLQAGAPAGPAKQRGQKPCDGTFPGADRWPTGAPTWSRHHQPRVNLSFHLSSCGPEGLVV